MAENNLTTSSAVGSCRQDIDATKSTQSGVKGFLETLLRKFRTFCYLIALVPIYILGAVCIGIGILPGMYLCTWINRVATSYNWPEFVHLLVLSIAIGIGYFLYGFTLIFLLPALNWILHVTPKPWRGIYYSLNAIPWYIHNGLTYLMRFTFLRFVTPSPWNTLFYCGMGMKIGHGTLVNTTNISDPGLIELGKKVTIGGSVTIVAHYGMGGFLIIAPVKIGHGSVIGMRAIIMGDVEIGENVKILPNSVVMPKSRIPSGETWGGVPARPMNTSNSNEQIIVPGN